MHKGLLLFLFLTSTLLGQNLVTNGFFEEKGQNKPIHKPLKEVSGEIVNGWYAIDGSTPDYFNSYNFVYWLEECFSQLFQNSNVRIPKNLYNTI